MATPRVPPISRVVSFTADPAPARPAGSAPMIASVAGPAVNARPAAISAIDATIRPQYAESTDDPAASTKPALISARPPAITAVLPTRFIATMATGDSAPVTTANGRVATPASRMP